MSRVLREARRFAAARPGPVVVATSGGADSVALLRSLHASGATVVVAHVNHGLRGGESDADEAFVRDLCAALGVDCRVRCADVAALAAGDNLESVARRVRYEFFAEVAGELGAGWVATAHTADDQAETVLHRLIRGTGLQGLRGIAAERPTPPGPPSLKGRGENEPLRADRVNTAQDATAGFTPLPTGRGTGGVGLLRPLLSVTRAEILSYLGEIGQPFRTDSTNADPRFTRNRIRHELLPLLKTFNPDVVSALAHLAEHANEAQEIVTAAAAELLSKAERPRAGAAVILDVAVLRSAPKGLTRAALRLVWEREGWPRSDMTAEAWSRAVEVACGGAAACDFPGGVRARFAGAVVQLTRRA